MNGPDAAEQIRLAGFEGPIIGICGSGEGDADARQEFIDAGADLVLTKPATGPQLLKAIADATTLRAARAAAAAEACPSTDAEVRVVGLSLRRTFSPVPESTLRGRNTTSAGFANIKGSASRRLPTLSPSGRRDARAAAAFHTAGDRDDNGDRVGRVHPWRMRSRALGRSHRVRDVIGVMPLQPGRSTRVRNVIGAMPPPQPRRSERLPPGQLGPPVAPGVPQLASAEMIRAESAATMLDEAAVVRWEDLVSYFLAFKCPEHRTEQVR